MRLSKFPEKSAELLESLVTTAKRAGHHIKKLAEYPERIVVRYGDRSFYAGIHLLTQEDVPVYTIEGSRHDSLDHAIDAATGSPLEVEIEE